MADRWFVVPVETAASRPYSDTPIESPKYGDQVESYSGRTYNVPSDDSLPFAGQRMYLVQFTADTATLDSIESNGDAYTRQEHDIPKSKVASYLNDLTGQSHSYDEWTARIATS